MLSIKKYTFQNGNDQRDVTSTTDSCKTEPFLKNVCDLIVLNHFEEGMQTTDTEMAVINILTTGQHTG